MKILSVFKTFAVLVGIVFCISSIAHANAQKAEIGKGPAVEEESAEIPVQEEKETKEPEMKMEGVKKMKMEGMKKMKMYKAAEVDGCTDFHCLKCKDRNACSRGKHYCDIKECGHKHGAVICHSGILFYLRTDAGIRDEQGNLSLIARAKGVTERLNDYLDMAAGHESCYFTVLDETQKEIVSNKQTPTIWFKTVAGGHANMVVTVTESDLSGYKYRSRLPDLKGKSKRADKLTKKLVAQWWAYILKDHFKMMVLSEAPYLTVYTHCGMVLKKMWNIARKKVPEGKIPMKVWNGIVKNDLSEKELDHLFLAAQIIPKDFDPNIR